MKGQEPGRKEAGFRLAKAEKVHGDGTVSNGKIMVPHIRVNPCRDKGNIKTTVRSKTDSRH